MADGEISERGIWALKPSRDDIDEFLQGLADPYHPATNTNGYLVLLVAENKLTWPMMKAKISEVSRMEDVPDWIACYGDLRGEPRFRKAIASMMEETFVQAPVDSNCLVCEAGCGAVVESLAWCLAEPGDVVIIPAPMYSAFPNDFSARAGMVLKVAPMKHPEYELTESLLQKAYDECVAAGTRPKILVMCNPCNPIGIIYGEATIRMCVKWCRERKIHLISDEIYGNSVFPNETFCSTAKICRDLAPESDDYLGDYVHLVYAFSKDFGLSGLRVGMLFSHNKRLLSAVTNMTYFQSVSNHTQWVMTGVLEDKSFMRSYISATQERLHRCYRGLEDALAAIQVPLTPCQGTLMAWADFRHLLREDTWEAEKELWLDLFNRSRVLLTTGRSCHAPSPGFFRVCYAWPAATEDDPAAAMKELRRRLVAHFAAHPQLEAPPADSEGAATGSCGETKRRRTG